MNIKGWLKRSPKPADRWYAVYKALDLCGGELTAMVEDDEDMLDIRWPDGMCMDIGLLDGTYFITTLREDTQEGWNAPLSILEVREKSALPAAIQQVILRFRSGEA